MHKAAIMLVGVMHMSLSMCAGLGWPVSKQSSLSFNSYYRSLHKSYDTLYNSFWQDHKVVENKQPEKDWSLEQWRHYHQIVPIYRWSLPVCTLFLDVYSNTELKEAKNIALRTLVEQRYGQFVDFSAE